MEIILIHGTFASGAAWTVKDSPFHRKFGQHFAGVPITEFVWSGSNSHRARLDAAKVLVALIKERVSLGIEGPFVLVGHSHGGMAALYAMRELELDAATAGQVKVACLNTPFLVFAPRGFRILQILAHVFNVVLNFGAPALPFLAVNALAAAIGLFVGIKNNGGGAGTVSLLIYLALAGIGVVFGGKLVNWMFQRARSWSKDYAATISARCESGQLLNVRTATDEVPWYLRLWSLVSNLSGLVPWLGLTTSAVVAAGVTLVTMFLLFVLMMMGESAQLVTAFGREGFPSRGEVSNFYSQLGDLLVMPVLLFVATPLFFTVFLAGLQATLLFMLVTRSLPVSFGDFAITAILLKVSVMKVPTGGVALKTVLVKREGLGLSHSSVHESESTIKAVVRWIQEFPLPQKHGAAGS